MSYKKTTKNTVTHEETYLRTFELTSPITTIMAGLTYPKAPYEIYRKNSDCYSFEYILEGDGVVQHGENIYRAKAGDMLILHANVYHHCYANPKKPWKKLYFLINGNLNFISHLISDYSLENVVYLEKVETPLKIEQIFKLLKHNLNPSHHTLELLIHAHIIGIAQLLSNSVASNHHMPDVAEQIKLYLDNKINGSSSIDDISRYVGLGKTQVIKLFSQKFGITPMAYLAKIRIKAAKSLLINSKIPIFEIATNLSFNSSDYFCKAFKKQTGYTPTEYRQKFTKPNKN